jgi:hypothetical protein
MKTLAAEIVEEPDYTLDETISALHGWAHLGKRMYPIEVANSAIYWLERAPASLDVEDVLDQLKGWLADETPNMPDSTGELALRWLLLLRSRRRARKQKRGKAR